MWYWTRIGVPVKIIGNASNYKYKKREKLTHNNYKHRKYATKHRKHIHIARKKQTVYEVVEVYDSW